MQDRNRLGQMLFFMGGIGLGFNYDNSQQWDDRGMSNLSYWNPSVP